MKVLRSSLIVAAAVLTAACGDKVTVAAPTTPVAQVRSVTVAPATATLANGQSVTLTAAVTADAGAVTTPIVWSSSNSAIAAVTQTGVVTAAAAPASGSAGICAAVGGASGCATILVNAAPNVTPASVSIASVTVSCTGLGAGANCGLNVPVNPLAVVGQIDVRVNVTAGSAPLTGYKLNVLIGTTVVGTQTFSSTASAALAAASAGAIEAQISPPAVVFSVNTAAFNAATGVPSFVNGTYILSAQLVPPSGSSTTATSQTSLTFANVNTFALTSSVTGGKTATSAAGFSYRSGSISASVLPVIYTPGITMAGGTITFGVAGCDATGPRSLALVAPVAPSTAWTATFTAGNAAVTPAAVGNFNGYEFRTAICTALVPSPLATGEGFTVTATDNNGNAFLAATPPSPLSLTANTYRMDNVAPGVPTLVQNPNLRQNAWINGNVAMTGANSGATSNGWMVNGAADLGVGGYTRMIRVAAPGAGNIVDPALAATATNTPTLPAPSLTNAGYCGVFSATDALGNESALPAAGVVCTAPAVLSFTALAAQHMLFGVDIAPPTIAFSAGLAANARLNGGTVGAEFQVTVTDTGTVGNSGMQSTSSVVGTVQIRNPAGTTCLVGATAACNPKSVNIAPAFPLVPTTVVAASVVTGYYFYSAVSQDAAGNQSGAVTRVIAYDPAANIPSLTTSLFNVPLTGSSVVFNANGADNFDLWKVNFNLTYPVALAGPIVYPSFTINTFPVASAGPAAVTFVNSNVPISLILNAFMRQVENETSACNVALTVGGAVKPTGLNEALFDQANNSSGNVPTAIPAASVTTGVSYTAALAPVLTQTFIISNGVTVCNTGAAVNAAVNISTGAGPAAAVNALSVTLNADVYGPTATFNPPFTRVDLYALIGGNLEQIGSTTSFTTVDNGAAFGRRHRFSFAWTPGTASPITATPWVLGAQSLYAIGVNTNGDALVTVLNANITLTNP